MYIIAPLSNDTNWIANALAKIWDEPFSKFFQLIERWLTSAGCAFKQMKKEVKN